MIKNSRGHELFDIREVDPTIGIDIRYATPNNFTKQSIYHEIAPLLIREAADALTQVQKKLRPRGLSLKIWDAYRPLEAQRKLWGVWPDERYIANPDKDPPHCSGIAVDITLTDLAGSEILMPTNFDDFTEKAHRGGAGLAAGVAAEAHKNSQILEEAMKEGGFLGFPTEWWHFDYPASWWKIDYDRP